MIFLFSPIEAKYRSNRDVIHSFTRSKKKRNRLWLFRPAPQFTLGRKSRAGMTLTEIAEAMGMSRERLSRIFNRAVRRVVNACEGKDVCSESSFPSPHIEQKHIAKGMSFIRSLDEPGNTTRSGMEQVHYTDALGVGHLLIKPVG